MAIIAPGITVPVVSVTRQLAAALTEVRKTGRLIHHLGAGYPNPEVSAPTAYMGMSDNYFRILAGTSGVPPERLYRDVYGYTDTMGPRSAREAFARVYGADFGFNMDPDHMVPSMGATGGIDLLCSLFESSGERIAYIVDAPTYPGFLSRATRQRGNAFYSVPMDSEGSVPEVLQAQIRKARSEGYSVAFYYTVPDGHNPGGISFSQERREAIYRVLQEENILLVEDAPYTYISFTEAVQRPKPFVAMDPDGRVVHLFTASKIGLPGPRVAYVYAPGMMEISEGRRVRLSELVVAISASTILMHNPQALRGFEAYLHDESGRLKPSLWPTAEGRIVVYRENRDVLLAGLETYLGSTGLARWTTPGAGFFSVITFLDGRLPHSPVLAERLLREHGVTSVPMVDFYASDHRQSHPAAGADQLRLAFSFTEQTGEARVEAMRKATEVFAGALLAMAR